MEEENPEEKPKEKPKEKLKEKLKENLAKKENQEEKCDIEEITEKKNDLGSNILMKRIISMNPA